MCVSPLTMSPHFERKMEVLHLPNTFVSRNRKSRHILPHTSITATFPLPESMESETATKAYCRQNT